MHDLPPAHDRRRLRNLLREHNDSVRVRPFALGRPNVGYISCFTNQLSRTRSANLGILPSPRPLQNGVAGAEVFLSLRARKNIDTPAVYRANGVMNPLGLAPDCRSRSTERDRIDHQSCKDSLKRLRSRTRPWIPRRRPREVSGTPQVLLHRDKWRVALRFVKAPAARGRVYSK